MIIACEASYHAIVMSTRPEPQWLVYRASQPTTLPEAANDLLGHEVTRRFEAYQAGDRSEGEPACLAAVDEQGQWLATLLMLLEEANGETVGSIRQLVVPPAHRGQGLAGRLIRRATTLAAEAGASRVRSTAGWGCPDHLAMYARLRFDTLAAREMPYLVSKPVER